VFVGQGAERLGAPDGLSACAPSSFPQRGTQAVGVQRPWCGHRGKVDNGQGGGCMGDVSRHDQALLDVRRSLPADGARDEQRRQACQVPLEVRAQTRQEQCLERLDAWGDQVPPGWVTGADALGRHTQCRHQRRERDERDVLGGPCQTTMRDRAAPLPAYAGRGRPPKAPWPSVTPWRPALPGDAWTHVTGRDGEKGLVESEMVRRRVQTRLERKRPGPEEGRVVTRRPLTDAGPWEAPASRDATEPDERYCSPDDLTPTAGCAGAFTEPSLGALARVIQAGACSAARCKRGQSEVGMDAYQGRTWAGWHHHMA
jgi:hypothetical protein